MKLTGMGCQSALARITWCNHYHRIKLVFIGCHTVVDDIPVIYETTRR